MCKHFSSALPQLPASASPLPHPWSSGSAGRPVRPARGRAGPQPAPGRMAGTCRARVRVTPGSARALRGTWLRAMADAGRSRPGSGESGLRPHCPHSLESLVCARCVWGTDCAAYGWGPHGARRPKSLAGPVRLVGVLGSGTLLLLQAVRWHGLSRAAGFVAGWSPGVNELGSPGGS